MKRIWVSILFILLFSFFALSQQPSAKFGGSPGLPEGYYNRAVNLLNNEQYVDGALYLQQIITWFPESEYAARAKEMNTIVYRLHLAPPADNRAYAIDTSFAGTVTEIDEPAGLAIDSKQNLYFTDKDKKSLVTFDPSGRQTNSSLLTSPYNISIASQDQVVIANDENVLVANQPVTFSISGSKGSAQLVEEIRSVAIDSSGKYYIVSGKYPGILVFDANKSQIVSSAFAMPEKQFYKVLINGRNEILALDKDRKQIMTFDATGKVISSIGPAGKGYQLEKVEDFALDSMNHVYVLEKNPRSVLIFSSTGALMKVLLSDKKTPLAFDDARVIAVGPSGSIYLLDKDSHRILKIG